MVNTKILTPVAISSSTGQHHSALSAGAEGAVWVDNRPDAWIQYDLGSPLKVGSVNVGFGEVGTGAAKRKYLVSVRTSVDGIGFTPALQNKKSSGKPIGKERFAFKPRTARYVQLVIHSNSDIADPYRASVDVFEVLPSGAAVKTKAKRTVKKQKKGTSRRR